MTQAMYNMSQLTHDMESMFNILLAADRNLPIPDNLSFKSLPIAMELIPVAVQVTGIAAFLFVTREETTYTFAAIILGLVWLKVSENKSPQEYGEKRAARHLFGKLGEWLDQKDAKNVFDDAQSKYLMFEGSIEADEYKAVVTAAGIANSLRGLASFLVNAYLVFVVFEVVVSS